MRVSVVATGIDQSANRLMHAHSFAEPLLPPNVARASLDRTAGAPVSTVELRRPIAAGTEFDTPRLFQRPVIPFPEPMGRRQALDEETHFDPPAIRRLLDKICRRSVGKATGSKSIGLNWHWAAGNVGSTCARVVQLRSTRPAASIGRTAKSKARVARHETRSHSTEYHPQVVCEHFGDRRNRESDGLRDRGDRFEVSQTPGRVAIAKVSVERLVARGRCEPFAFVGAIEIER